MNSALKSVFNRSQCYLLRMLLGGLFFINWAAAVSAQSMEFELPLIVNRAVSGDIPAKVTIVTRDGEDETSVELKVGRLRQLLTDYANEEQLASWLVDDGNDVLLPLQELRARGLKIEFDPGLLELTAVVPLLGLQKVSIRGRRKPVVEDHYQQSGFASGLSYRLRNRFNHSAATGDKTGLVGLQADLTGFTSIGGFGGWSLFYRGNYDEAEDTAFARNDVTLIHDSYKHGLRYAFGDVRPTVSRFQASPSMLGVSIERNYSEINPFRNLRPSGRSAFTLETDAKVSFEVNGSIVMVEELPSGTYSISDFPLATGANNVRVYVDSGVGNVEVANFSTYVDTTLLEAGVSNFGVTAGTQLERTGNVRRRDYGEDVSMLGFYERGINSNLTLGAQAELSENHALVSSSAIYGTRVGVVALQAAMSKRDGHDSGAAALLQYNYNGVLESNWGVNYDAQLRYRSDSFLSLAEDQVRGEEWAINLGTSFSKSGSSFSVGGELSQTDELLTKRLRLSHSRQIAGLSLSLGYQFEDIEGRGRDNKFSISILKTLGGSRVRGQYNSDKQEFRGDWAGDAARAVGESRASASVIKSEELDSINFLSDYIGSNFEANYRHQATKPKADGRDESYVSTLTVAGGVGYADGAFGYGRPFDRGFMIVDRHQNLKSKNVSVLRGSTSGDLTSRFKRRSKALIPLSNNYRTERFIFSVDDLPNGYDIGSGDVKLYPGNLAGFRYQLGSDAANTVMGKVFWPDGTPLNLVSGRVIPVDNVETGDEEGVLFTNRTGRFVAEKLKFGDYYLVFGASGEFKAKFTVAEGDEPGLVMLGNVTLEQVK